jgi:osmoprotectant transport system ATP-binding protein
MTSPRLLALNRVAKRYGDTPVLEDINLDIAAGEFVALVGTSGSGKTTLLKTINWLRAADGGSVTLQGQDVATIPPAELRRRIGYVFQQIGLFPHMTVAENIAIVPRLTGMSRAARTARVSELMALLALPKELARRYPAALSGGQAQRVGIARALAGAPALMLMDEPFGALDPVTRDDIGRSYRDLHDRLGLTTVMVTHDMTEALLIADRIVVLDTGRVIADCPPEALIAGHPDPAVAALIAVPRRQAERLAKLARR